MKTRRLDKVKFWEVFIHIFASFIAVQAKDQMQHLQELCKVMGYKSEND